MKTNNNNKRGFTLIELMVVLAIILVVAFIVIGVGFMAVASSRQIKARQALTNNIPAFVVGEAVALSFPNNVMVTGKVSQTPNFGYPYYSVMVVGSNGVPTTVDKVPASALFVKKVETLERY